MRRLTDMSCGQDPIIFLRDRYGFFPIPADRKNRVFKRIFPAGHQGRNPVGFRRTYGTSAS